MKDFIIAREYIHKKSIGKEVDIDNAILSVRNYLSNSLKEKTIEGYRLLYINSLDKAERKLVKESFYAMTQHVYPFLYLAVQFYDKEGNKSILDFLQKRGFLEI